MRRVFVVLMALVLATMACSLGGDDEQNNGNNRSVFSTVTRVPTFMPGAVTPTSTFTNVVVASPTTDTGVIIVGPALPPSTCSYPAGWQPYIVRAGDTLNVIAASIGATTDVLVTGNCLTNPDAIYVGQTLYLPSLPAIVPTLAATTVGCVVPSGWQPYVVRAGDTLSLIALSIASTVDTLVSGNCLTNPDALFVGQTLYLPNLPAVVNTPVVITTPVTFPTATTAPGSPPVFTQLLRVSPSEVRSDGAFVTRQRTISLDVGTLPNAENVRYFAGTSATDQNPVQVGIDLDPFNGTRLNYTLSNFDNELFFIAVAENDFGFTSSNIVHLVYDPTTNSTLGSPVIQPFTAFTGSQYTLQVNNTVSVSWPQAPQDAVRIEFYYTPTSGAAQVIGTDSTPANGAIVTWLVPSNLSGEVFARAVYTNTLQDSQRVQVQSGN